MRPEWTNVGNISVAQGLLSATERDSVNVLALASAKKAVYTPTPGAKAAEFRFITPDDSDFWILAMYVARGAYDHYIRTTIYFAVTGGAQVHSTGKVFCDTVTAVNKTWYGNLPAAEQIQTETNYIARYHLRLMGYTQFVFIATDIVAGKILEVEVAEME